MLSNRGIYEEQVRFSGFPGHYLYGTGINAFTNTDISLLIVGALGFVYIYLSKKKYRQHIHLCFTLFG